MNKKNRIITTSLREIKGSFPRFISLLIMSMLGVFCFSGLQATSPDMLNSLDYYLDRENTYDVKIISTMGLTDDDIKYLRELENINKVEGSHSVDVLIKEKEKQDIEYVINVTNIPKEINNIELLDGRLPETNGEIVVEENFLKKTNYKIGDKIIIDNDSLNNKEFIIVGTIRSSLYFNNVDLNGNRGNTSIGTGIINFYTYILDSNFEEDYYTSIYLIVENTKEFITNSSNYLKNIDKVINNLEKIKEERENARYDSLYKEALEKIESEESKMNSEFLKAENKLNDAKKELNKAKNILNSTKNTLNNTKIKLNNAKTTLDNYKKIYNDTLKNNNIKENEIDSNINKLDNSISNLEKDYTNGLINEHEYNDQKVFLTNSLNGLLELKKTRDTLKIQENKYNNGLKQYNEGYKAYQNGLNTYNKNLNLYNESILEFNKEKTTAINKINNAKGELKEIERPTWYIYERLDNTTYSEFVNDADSIANLSAIFPVIFFSVSILISLISMNRMIEDDRNEIGTLKSLGFSNIHILTKYLLFSFLAVLIGGIIGAILGLIIIPKVIWSIYELLFTIPVFKLTMNLDATIIGFLISFVCICGTSILTVYKIVKEKPAMLLRPKSPKKGKRVLLENIHFIWKKLNFSNKVIVRNIFRYKKRVLVTIGGVTGCTALMLCGMGIRDSVMNISKTQYGELYNFDAMVYLGKNLNDKDLISAFNDPSIKEFINVNSLSARVNNIDVNLVISASENFINVVNLIDKKDNSKIKLVDNEVIITDKLAELLKVNINDEIKIIDIDNHEYKVKINYIVKNYIGHYIYMNKETYSNLGGNYENNLVYLKTHELDLNSENKLLTNLLKNDDILSVVKVETIINSVENMLQSLNKVVVILILLASSLSFIVLYNLSNININERKREIATLKVLGFYDQEVDNYITKENIILTIIGIILGLIGGYYLTIIVIKTVEMDNTRFIYNIRFISYLLSAIIAIIFTYIVNFATHFSLKKIEMIDSLKSVE